MYQTNNFLLPQLKSLVDGGDILNIRPEYQRRLRWSNPQKSRLIESLLLNVPVPPIFLYETQEARYEVMDGQQRLNAIKEFLAGSFALSGLTVLTPLNGIRYSKAPPKIKRALDRASLSAIVLLLESDTEADALKRATDIRRFIFDRLNSGGKQLNAQELRNAIYPGDFNRAIVELARNKNFTDIFGIPEYTEADPSEYYENPKRQANTLYATMADCQLIVRYFALRDDRNIRGSMKSMLDRAMENGMSYNADQVDALRVEFLKNLNTAIDVFGDDTFLLPPDDKGRRRVSAAMYDSTLVALNRIRTSPEDLVKNRAKIQKALKRVMDTESVRLLTGQENTAQAVKDRIELMRKILES
ncbi:MAG: hypothetical protein B0A82_09040 [Alkalinema sp. CACIAM 70d]|nr:MAG: hypothetical protein B0A82_09040 [Alkalinema sp. CACIAM 70d]